MISLISSRRKEGDNEFMNIISNEVGEVRVPSRRRK